MKINYWQVSQYFNDPAFATPEAFITKNKQRLKQNGQNVYLKNGEEFEIELFNAHIHPVLAKFKINGVDIPGGGLMLDPGQRVFLDRYLHDNKKFIFNTYDVEKGNAAVDKAIANNGTISIQFYQEELYSKSIWDSPDYKYKQSALNNGERRINVSNGYNSVNNTLFNSTTTGTNNSYGMTLTSFNTSGLANTVTTDSLIGNTAEPVETKETGRVGMGSESSQRFENVNNKFKIYPFKSIIWHILPESEKVYQASDLKVYCTECGTKIKKSTFKFCPQCGTKI